MWPHHVYSVTKEITQTSGVNEMKLHVLKGQETVSQCSISIRPCQRRQITELAVHAHTVNSILNPLKKAFLRKHYHE